MNRLTKILIVIVLLTSFAMIFSGCVATTTEDGTEPTFFEQYGMILFLVVIFAFFWFVMVRPQRKRQKEHQQMMDSLQRGDKVITAGGIHGTIDNIGEDSVVIKVEGGTTLRIARTSVAVIKEK